MIYCPGIWDPFLGVGAFPFQRRFAMLPSGDPVYAGTLGFIIVMVVFLLGVYFIGYKSE